MVAPDCEHPSFSDPDMGPQLLAAPVWEPMSATEVQVAPEVAMFLLALLYNHQN